MIIINTFYKNKIDIAIALKELIDNYWERRISETDMINNVNEILRNNRNEIFVDGKYSKIIEHKCGKRRLALIDKIKRRDLIE